MKTKRLLSLMLAFTVLATAFVFAPVSAASATRDADLATVDFWVGGQETSAAEELGTVRAHFLEGQSTSYTGGNAVVSDPTSEVYLFLPSNADTTQLKVYFNESSATLTYPTESGTAGSVTLANGDTTDAFDYGCNSGQSFTLELGSKTYTLLVYKSANIGTVYFTTVSGNTDNIDYSNSNSDHTVSEAGTIRVIDENGKVDYSGIMEKIQGRGNGTWSNSSKLPYNIKLATSSSLLGMGKAKKWVLLANSGDGTLVDNQLTYDFAKYIGVQYQVVCKPVDVYANGKYFGSYQLAEKVEIKSDRVAINDSYEALELANGTTTENGTLNPADFETMESNDIITTRIIDVNNSNVTLSSSSSITTASSYAHTVGSRKYTLFTDNPDAENNNLTDPADLTGGYLYELEISQRWPDGLGFCAYNRQGWTVKSHDYASRHQIDYSFNLLYAMGSSVYNGGTVPSKSTTTNCSDLSNLSVALYGAKSVTNPAPSTFKSDNASYYRQDYTGYKWSDILDADSAVKYYWTQEYFKNMDSSTSSTYFWKDSDSVDTKVHAGPVWDMDNAICYTDESASRWGYSYGSPEGWYTKNTRIYRWRAGDKTLTYSTDSQAPLSFYGALATNCSDFWEMAKEDWYKTIRPATQILLGNATDSTGTLKSVREYVETVAASGKMNNVRYGVNSGNYDVESIISGIEGWFTRRNTFIDGELDTLDISAASVEAIPAYSYTGSEIKPLVNATYSNSVLGTLELSEGVDYTLTYENNINPSASASVTLVGAGRYAGSSKTVNFTITTTDISQGSLSIFDGAYIGDEVTPTLLDSNGVQITNGVNYTWYLDGVQVGTGGSYTVSQGDGGKVLTAVATGNGTYATGTITSNACPITATVRPSGTVKNIATFSYKYGDDGLSLQGGKNKGYDATAGVQKDTAKFYASVNGTERSKIEWSGSDSFTRTDGTSGQQPVMSASSSSPWQEFPYFDIAFSADGYSDISFACDIGATSKGAADYLFLYSVDGGESFNTIYDAENDDDLCFYLETTDKKVMKTAFDLTLPASCDGAESVIVRIQVADEYTVDGSAYLFTRTNTSGKIAINNIEINGTRANDVTGLEAPEIRAASAVLYNDDVVELVDNNAGVDVYYTITDANGNESGVYTYDGAFAPFSLVSSATATVTAWSELDIYKSAEVTQTFTYAGDALARFNYNTYSEDVIAGAVSASGGVFGKSAKMSAKAMNTAQYVPLYNSNNKAFAISPDDGVKWDTVTGFYFEVQTAGYEGITFSCDAYTTNQGPKSATLQYSTDGSSWSTVSGCSNLELPANGTLENYLNAVSISASGAQKLYFRLVTMQDLTLAGEGLHNNASKGNLYINNVIIGGTPTGDLRMPYTNKTTNYFGSTGTIKYYSPDNAPMQFSVVTESGKQLAAGSYSETGIQIASLSGFSPYYTGAYIVSVFAGDDDEQSAANVRRYYYKGDTVAEFDYGSTKFANNIAADSLSISATAGTGTLAMYPDGATAATLAYASSYGVKVSASADNSWAYSGSLDNPSGKGYWLISTSTLGYTGITLSLDMATSNKAPRDWGVAYSLDGVNYTYVSASNSRGIEATKPIEVYSNLTLPAAVDNQENVYIKLFINGGENLAGYELDDTINSTGKGNAGINGVELCGVAIQTVFDVSVKTTVLETAAAQSGTLGLAGVDVLLNGEPAGTTDENGSLALQLEAGTYTLTFATATFGRTVSLTVSEDAVLNVPLVAVDLNGDGFVNMRDYSLINSEIPSENQALYKSAFTEFLNVSQTSFTYA